MVIEFTKYHGAGNDFVIIDDREEKFPENDIKLIELMCHRRYGIGADGLMLLRNHSSLDFEMIYYNADGKTSSMCGNGGRCIAAFAHSIGMIDDVGLFHAIDGTHEARVISIDTVALQMNDVQSIEKLADNAFLLDTGSPHYVSFVEDVDAIALLEEARKIRYSERFKKDGVNVNFVQLNSDGLDIRTYERGVEDETLACGTGVTAAAIAANYSGQTELADLPVKARGGLLNVKFQRIDDHYNSIWKTGPVAHVFNGRFHLT